MNLKIGIIAAVIALVVSGGLWLALPAKSAGNHEAVGNLSNTGTQSNLPNATNYDYLVARLAIGLGTNLSTPGGANNINIEAQKANLTAATTTPCNIQNPFSATSTLLSATINVTTGTSTAIQFVFATSTAMNATTSPIFTATIPASSLGTWTAGETASSTGLGIIVPPTGWVTAGVTTGGGSAGNTTLGGTCSAVFQSI